MQRLFSEAKEFYQTEFGRTLDDIPGELMSTQRFLRTTPSMVTRAVQLLNIDAQDQHLYWLSRLYNSLPLPPNWTESDDFESPEYEYEPWSISF